MFLWRKRTTPPICWRRNTSRNCTGGASLPSNVSKNCCPTACSSVIAFFGIALRILWLARLGFRRRWLRLGACVANWNEAGHHQSGDGGDEHPDEEFLVPHPFLDITAHCAGHNEPKIHE